MEAGLPLGCCCHRPAGKPPPGEALHKDGGSLFRAHDHLEVVEGTAEEVGSDLEKELGLERDLDLAAEVTFDISHAVVFVSGKVFWEHTCRAEPNVEIHPDPAH